MSLKYKLPILTLVFLPGAYHLGLLPVASRPSVDDDATRESAAEDRSSSSPSPDPPTERIAPKQLGTVLGGTDDVVRKPVTGDELVARAARQVLEIPAFEAKIRQTVHLYGHDLLGSGTYRQSHHEGDVLTRLELKLTGAGQVTLLLQVSDGQYLWTRRDLPDDKSLSTVNLDVVRQAAEKSDSKLLIDGGGAISVLGGVSQLLQGLADNFHFESPREVKIGTVPIWEVHGGWRRERLARLLPSQASEILAGGEVSMPEHLPHRVRLILGRDRRLPYFPYQVVYFRTATSGGGPSGQGGPSSLQPIGTLELFEVKRLESLDPAHFRYDAGNQEIKDHTGETLRRLGVSSEKTPEEE